MGEAMPMTAFKFEPVSAGLVASEPLVAGPRRIAGIRSATDLSLVERSRLLQLVMEESSLAMVASISRVQLGVVRAVLNEMATALQWAQLADHFQVDSTRKQCALLRCYDTWARTARQDKHDLIVKAIEREVRAGRWQYLKAIWQAWLISRDGEHLHLTNAPAAGQLVSFLLRAGIPRASMLIVSHVHAGPLALEVSSHQLDQRVLGDRRGRACHRLQFCDSQVRAGDAAGAALTMLGLHWWLLCLGSMTISREATHDRD